MSRHRNRKLDRPTAERLLRGEPVGHGAGAEALAELLAAAAPPSRPGQLPGEQAALTAFRTARLETPLVPSGPSRWVAARRLLTVKVAAGVAVAGVLLTGAAFAATSGVLPTPFDHEPEVSPSGGAGSSTPASSTRQPNGSGVPTTPPGLTESTGLKGLCQSYQKQPPDARAKALESAAFRALVVAADGTERVDGYCNDLIGPAAQPPPPTDHPTGSPTVHPTGPPVTPKSTPSRPSR